jgi:ankyrin repeat protein
MNYNILFFDKIDVIELMISIHIKMDNSLIIACNEGNFHGVNHLIALGCNVNGKGAYYDVPLHIAVIKQHHNIVKLLLENGAVVNKPDPLGMFPLTISFYNQHIPTIELLLKA